MLTRSVREMVESPRPDACLSGSICRSRFRKEAI